MKYIAIAAFRAAGILLICACLAGCSSLPLKEGGLEISKDTTVGIDDIGVGTVTRQF
ncbi:MAG: hypothetical protein WC522_04225 [Candidatus Omnitrophota bacterium]